MKRVSKRMWSLLTVSALVLGVSGAALAMDNMSMPADPAAGATTPMPASAPMPVGTPMNPTPAMTPAAAPAAGPASLTTLGLTADQINALNPLIDQARKVEQTKQSELAKLQADRAVAASQAKPDAKKIANLDKLIQIKQGEITVARGQAQISFAKVVGDAKAKAVADIVFAIAPAAASQQALNHNQWLDQMNQTMDQMMKRLPELSQKDPDQALKLMNEMLKVMGQMTSMMNDNDRRGMMAPTAAAPAPAAANSGMQMGNASDPQASAGGMGMGMMQQEMNMMQQMMQMMPMMNDNKDPNMSSGNGMNMNTSPDPMAAPDPNAGGMGGGMMGMDMMKNMM